MRRGDNQSAGSAHRLITCQTARGNCGKIVLRLLHRRCRDQASRWPKDECAPACRTGKGVMDLNYYLHREQVERIRADSADTQSVRDAHLELAELYRQQIEEYRAGRIAGYQPRPAARPAQQPMRG